MRIDASVYQALDGDTVLLTLDEVIAMLEPVWCALERELLATAAADAIARGWHEADVKLVIEEQARLLRDSRPARLETIKQMLEARATSIQ